MMVVLEILILTSAISVTLAPVLIKSALFLMLTFMAAGIYIALLGAELLGLLFFLIYIGAISVLFLFVIMLIQAANNQVKQFNNVSIADEPTIDLLFSALGFFFIIYFIYLVFLTLCYSFPFSYDITHIQAVTDFSDVLYTTSEVHQLGTTLFIDYWFGFLILTFLIIAASFGVIVILK
jgi:NADH:ubiquinone oxidoreductase subunit 6 (subunit J)